ncbi:MAG: hypothetical protein HY237_11035 [Acidobacteria bacterium]|nr:hypothetical protein [Acidobacteriota bacterium]
MQFSEHLAPEELHHHDVVHFSLDEVLRELSEGKGEEVLTRLRAHLEENKARRNQPS